MDKQDGPSSQLTVVDSARRWQALDPRELWAHRDLLANFIVRDIKLRYKQTVLGAGWAILQPTLTMIVFTFLFDRLAGMPSDRRPYPIFSYAALLPWTFFAASMTRVSNSIVGNANMIRKVYFPRLLVPIAAIGTGLIDFLFASLVLLGLMAHYDTWPSAWSLIFVPLLILLAAATALGLGLWLAALNVRFRDIGYALPFAIQLWMFLTPVIYPTRVIVSWLERRDLPGWLCGVNPMAGVVEGFRAIVLGVDDTPRGGAIILTSCLVAGVLLVSGVLYFAHMEDTFADEI